jgi:hypothetical protein
LSRHRKFKLSKSKAIVVATAGALSVATVATAAVEASPAPVAASSQHVHLLADTQTQQSQAQENMVTVTRADVLRDTASAHLAAAQHAVKAHAAAAGGASSASTPALTAAVSSGSPEQIAQAMLGSFGWSSSQFTCLDPLWAHESGWSTTAYNAGSGAYGIPQALPGSRMASAGPDWQTNASTQIRWGLEYIRSTYGSPCAAYAHEEATGWY